MANVKIFNRIAHHGGGALLPPGNTIEAINEGVDAGADMVEIDVRGTHDDSLVLAHSMVRSVEGKDVPIRERTFTEWRALTDENSIEPPLVLLEDAFQTILQRGIGVLIDLKDPGLENTLARMVRKVGINPAIVMIGVPSDASRVVMRSLDPRIPLAHKIEPHESSIIKPTLIDELNTDAVFWNPTVITKERVARLKKRHIVVYAGPVVTATEMRRLRDECKVDGVVTEYPDLLSTI
jgi:glycerophosphoryl diester phosphodiesterase